MSVNEGYPRQFSQDARGSQRSQRSAYEAPEIRSLGNAREVFLGGTTGSASDSFKNPNRTCS